MEALGRRFEFHTHTFFSDGVLSPAELIRYGLMRDCQVLALTDHVDFSNVEHVLTCQKKMIDEVSWDIRVLSGVEITHVPKDKISKLAGIAKGLGAEIVVVHGETLMEPVEVGTNLEAVSCQDVDILAHPGNITEVEAEKAIINDVYLELSARKGHNKTNGRVAEIARRVGARMLVNSDAHEPDDLITQGRAFDIAMNAGLSKDEAMDVIGLNPLELINKIQ